MKKEEEAVQGFVVAGKLKARRDITNFKGRLKVKPGNGGVAVIPRLADYETLMGAIENDIDELKSGKVTESKARINVNYRRHQVKLVDLYVQFQRLHKGVAS